MKLVYQGGCDGGLAPKEHTIVVDDFRWHTLEWGAAGPPLALWHGITSSARNWWRTGPFLAGLGFHVFALDLPGHGSSDDAPIYEIETTARLLDGWLAALHLEAPVIMGHSWGGMNAIVHAALPDARVRARALVLEDPAIMLYNDPAPILPGYVNGVGTPPDDESLAILAASNPRWHECDVRWKALAREQVRRAAAEGFFVHNAGRNVREMLLALTLPTFVLLGDPAFGGIWQAAAIEEFRGSAPANITVDVIEGSTHNLHRDSWAAFSMALGKWAQRFVQAQPE